MESPSEFQKQYPLSPRKFWKKMLLKLSHFFSISFLFGFCGGVSIVLLRFTVTNELRIGSIFLFGIGIFLVFFITLYTVYALYLRAYIARYYYDVTDQFISIKKGVFAPTEIHVQYQKIQDVYVDQDIFDRMFGIYDVHIASATVTSGIEAHIDGVNKEVAEAIKNLLLGHITGNGSGGSIAQKITAQPTVQSQGPGDKAVSFSSPISTSVFPIENTWITMSIVVSFFRMVLAYALFYGYIFIKMGVSSGSSLVRDADSWRFPGAVVLFGVFLFLFIVRVVWILLWQKTFYFEFQPFFILLKSGIISREEKHVRYITIQNVSIKQGVIERLFGFGTVVIENAAGLNGLNSRVELPGQPIGDAQKIVESLNAALGTLSQRSGGMTSGL